MKTYTTIRLAFASVLLILASGSCNKNEDYIIQEIDEQTSFLRVSVSELAEMFDGHAGHCNDGNTEVFHITNNTQFLDSDNNPQDFEQGDFLLIMGIVGTDTTNLMFYNYSYEYEGQIYNNIIAQDVGVPEDFEFLNGRVKGKLQGQFDIDELFDPDYEITFSSEVVELPALCN
jgi:hydrogenase maturation factor